MFEKQKLALTKQKVTQRLSARPELLKMLYNILSAQPCICSSSLMLFFIRRWSEFEIM